MHGNIRDYAVAATRYIIDLEESLDMCIGQVDGIAKWSAEVNSGKTAGSK